MPKRSLRHVYCFEISGAPEGGSLADSFAFVGQFLCVDKPSPRLRFTLETSSGSQRESNLVPGFVSHRIWFRPTRLHFQLLSSQYFGAPPGQPLANHFWPSAFEQKLTELDFWDSPFIPHLAFATRPLH